MTPGTYPLLLYSFVETPVIFLNSREKYATSLNPERTAVLDTEYSPVFRSSFAKSSRLFLIITLEEKEKCLLSESEENGEKFLYNLGLDQREIPTFACYYLNAHTDGEYTVSFKCKTDTPNAVIKVECNDTTIISCRKEVKPLEWQIIEGTIFLSEGFNELKITPLNYPEKQHVPLVGRFYGLCEQFAIMNITVKKAEL